MSPDSTPFAALLHMAHKTLQSSVPWRRPGVCWCRSADVRSHAMILLQTHPPSQCRAV